MSGIVLRSASAARGSGLRRVDVGIGRRRSSIPLMPTIADLAQRFAIAGSVSITAGHGGLPCIGIANRYATAQVYLLGAHVAHFQPDGQPPVLWMSANSLFVPGKPIRGGVPVCWPWFGAHPGDGSLPIHGFVRTREWALVEAATLHDGRTRVVLTLSGDAAPPMWPHAFALRYSITVGPTLELDLRVDNPGDQPFRFSEALHSYFDVQDVHRVRIAGLAGLTYLDKVGPPQQRSETGEIEITAETDRVYSGTTAICTLVDPLRRRRIVIAKQGSQTTVVWNPWIAKAKAMPDFADDEWQNMVCIETANALDHAITLPPGCSHHLVARISVEQE
jgi:D-hexose-6-phosphate mutarotase